MEMIRFYKHDFAIHDGTFSYMVNYDAIGQYFTNSGGRFFHTEGKSLSIQTVCGIELEQTDCEFERLQYLFSEKFNRINPMNSLCSTLPGKDSGNEIAQMTYLLGEIRLQQEDPQVLAAIAQRLVEIVPKCLISQQEDLLELMGNALANFYYYPGECNLPFWLSQIYFVLNKFEESLACLNMTSHYFGDHEALFFLKAQNYERLGQLQEAQTLYEQALAMNPEFNEAQDAMVSLENRLRVS
jgi:tetratricopeptide (TPR) repeat protein